MADAFLKDIASYLYSKYGNTLSDCAMVFPNRRAGLFFTRYLSSVIERPLWLPRVINISDLMQSVSRLQPADPVTLNFELYKVFTRVTGSSETIDQFYNWGEILITDFDEVDKYMVDATALFRNVAGLKQLDEQFDYMTPEQTEAVKGFWSTFKPRGESAQQKEFLRIWEALPEIYRQYREHLAGLDIAYEGMIFRDAAVKVTDGKLPPLPYEKIFIAGFNAVNECEKRLFDYLVKEEKSEFFWDYDHYYTSRQNHQAGMFMRGNLKRYPHSGFTRETQSIEKNKPGIEIIAVPSNSGQAKLLGDYAELFSDSDPAGTAVILPDERLLLPLLSSLPKEVQDINITMGYPLKENPVYSLVMNLISLQKNLRTDENGNPRFHHKDVVALLQHPGLRDADRETAERIRDGIIRKNRAYVAQSDLKAMNGGLLVFRKVDENIGFLDYLTVILKWIAGADDKMKNTDSGGNDGNSEYQGNDEDQGDRSVGFPVREFIFRLLRGTDRLKDVLGNADISIRFETLIKLLNKVLQGIRVPFYGEPLGGVQIMGVLETRALDFRNVIWLSMNEGIFPARTTGSSFIPYSLRRGYGLPGPEQQDAVYAYYFYRLLQHARKVILIYNTKSDGLFTGEVSRFIHQLRFDSNFSVVERSLVADLLPARDKEIIIEKSPGILDRLNRYVAGEGKYLSAGALNAFADCPLRFYFRYIARLPEPEEVSEEIDMAVFGNLLHKAAQLLYEPFEGGQVTDDDLAEAGKSDGSVERFVYNAFREVLSVDPGTGGEQLTGMYKIISGVLTTYLNEMVVIDRRITPFRIEALEKEFTASLKIPAGGGDIVVNFGGIIDRVDEVAGAARVVDYKTGGDDPVFSDVVSLFTKGDPKRRKAVFQTFFYAWLYLEKFGESASVTPVIYQVKKFFQNEPPAIFVKPSRTVKNAVYDFSQYREEFISHLRLLAGDLFNPLLPFDQVGDREVCKYCAYRKICNR